MSGLHRPSDLYAILGVPGDATQAVIDQAYRALVRRYHPDSRATGDAAQAVTDDTRLRDVMAAYLVLGNRDRRASYDRGNRTVSAPPVGVRVRWRASQVPGGPSVSAGPVYWYPPAPTVPESPAATFQMTTEPDPSLSGSSAGIAPRQPLGAPAQIVARWHLTRVETPDAEGARQRDGYDGASPTSAVAAPGGTEADLEPDLSEQIRTLTAQVTQLTFARDSNRRIGMAVGMVMNQCRLDEAHAFQVLRGISQNTNRKLRDIAEDVIRDRHV
jgi:curved DNA-binding protein CbpA